MLEFLGILISVVMVFGGYILLDKGYNIAYGQGAKNRVLWFLLAQLGFFIMIASFLFGLFAARGFK